MISKFAKASLSLVVASTIAACAYQAGDENNPLLRKITWFSYLDSGDLRTSCTAGSPDRYRLVYNGHYQEQVRTYDISTADDGSASLHQHVFGEANLAGLEADASSAAAFLKSVAQPWQGVEFTRRLSAQQVADLKAGLAASPAPSVGLELASYGFYWIAAACSDGVFSYKAWKWPDGFENTAFVAPLMAVDPSDRPLNPPRKVPETSWDTQYRYDRAGDANYFQIKIGPMGLDHSL